MFQSRNVVLLVCWALVFVALIANAAMQFYNVNVLIENDRLVNQTHQVEARLNSLLSSFVDAETGVRGMIITGQDEFLKPFEDAEARIADEFRDLAELVKDDPGQRDVLAKIRDTHESHRAYMIEAVATRRAKGFDAARTLVRTNRGKALMDETRRRIAAMIATEDELLVQRSQLAKDHYRRAMVSGAIGTALSLAMTAVAVAIVWQEMRRRRAVETALQAKNEEVRLAVERFRLLTETVAVHIWISKPDGTAIFLNRSWQDYTGLATDEVGLEKWISTIHPDDAIRMQAIWKRSDGGSKNIYTDEVRVCRATDRSYRWHRCAVVAIRTSAGVLQSWVGSLTDIHDQKAQTEALEQAVSLRTQELRRANNTLLEEVIERVRAEDQVRAGASELKRSNEELEKFAYVASHDLQEPLRKIQAFGDRLLRKSREQLDEQSRDYLDRMLSSATRMRMLIDDLLTFSRIASTVRPFVPVDFNQLLAGVLTDLETSLAQSQGRVEAKPLPTIDADPLQMRQLMQNLIGNALKFAKPGEPPVVTIEAAPLASLPPSADPPPPAFAGWRLTIADRGIGFEQIHENRIFEVFQRLHGRGQYDGTGIGLAICRKIVERHGGAIHAKGQLDSGATFFVDLPQSPPATFLVPT